MLWMRERWEEDMSHQLWRVPISHQNLSCVRGRGVLRDWKESNQRCWPIRIYSYRHHHQTGPSLSLKWESKDNSKAQMWTKSDSRAPPHLHQRTKKYNPTQSYQSHKVNPGMQTRHPILSCTIFPRSSTQPRAIEGRWLKKWRDPNPRSTQSFLTKRNSKIFPFPHHSQQSRISLNKPGRVRMCCSQVGSLK